MPSFTRAPHVLTYHTYQNGHIGPHSPESHCLLRDGRTTMKKDLLLKLEKKKFREKNVTTYLEEGGWAKALLVGPLKILFMRLPYVGG